MSPLDRRTEIDPPNRPAVFNNPPADMGTLSIPAIEAAQAEQEKKEAEREKLRQEIAAEALATRAKAQEAERITRNNYYDNTWDSGKSIQQYEQSTGTRGYHFGKNLRGNDGNYYAEYASNQGSNRRYYSLSERKWKDIRLSEQRCNNCREFVFWVRPGVNTCPKCGQENKFDY